jgi:hypothetical protein
MNPKRGSAEGAIQSIAAPPSIPDVTLVEIDAVVAQQVAVCFLKCAIAMVVWLLLNVSEHSVELTRAHRKCAISALPGKAAIPRINRLDPFRRRLLYPLMS